MACSELARIQRPGRLRTAVLALVVVAGTIVGAPTATAHTDRHGDPNDSPQRFDIAAVKTTHNGDKMKFEITLHDTLHLGDVDLRLSRYFLIGLDLDQRASDHELFERCIFVIDRPGATAIATDCGSWRMDDSNVSRVGTRTMATTIDLKRLQVDGDFKFAVISYWGAESCRNDVCVDAAPNRLPLYLEDRTKPTVSLRVGAMPTEPTFPIEFTVKDGKGSGIKQWVLEKRATDSNVWATLLTGRGDGIQTPTISPGGGTWIFRIRATDKQGNTGVSPERPLSVPYDDPEFTSFATFSGSVTSVEDAQAFGGSYASMATDATVSMTLDAVQYGGCTQLRFYGPGGNWTISLSVDGGPPSTDSSSGPGPRDQWRYVTVCAGEVVTLDITVTSAGPFGIDYVAVENGSIVAQN